MSERALYGLVLCGGDSTRMGMHKALLQYHAQPQYQQTAALLARFCNRVLIACKQEQQDFFRGDDELLPDAAHYADTGPIAALLTAFDSFPQADWLVMACDYPLLTAAHWQYFFSKIDTAKPAAFYKAAATCYEPLLGFYPATCAEALHAAYARQQYSLQHFLQAMQAAQVVLEDEQVLQSIDTREQYEAMKQLIGAQ
jgi:molybdopterin-guanine dinucleotide biosynthesis protein A